MPYNEGVPEVAPRESVPDDYQHIQTNPNQFGELYAKGEQQLGQGLSTAGKFFGQVQTDDAATKAMARADAALSKFRTLRSGDALNAQQSTQDEIDAAFKEGREGLFSAEQQHEYDQVTRSFQLRYISGVMASHADQEAKAYAANTNNDGANFHLGLIAQNPNSDAVFNDNQAEIMRARVKQAQIEGRDAIGVQQAAAEGRAEAVAARVRSIAVNDPAKAYSTLDQYKDIASVVDRKSGVSYYDTLANEVRARSEQQNGVTAGQNAEATAKLNHPFANAGLPVWSSAAAAAPGGFSPYGLARTIKIESGGNPNAKNGNAEGLGQFMPATWDQFGQGDRKDPQQAILATQRYAAANAQALKGVLGRDPTDAELYLAHQQGAEGAERLLTNPNARAGSLVGDAAIRNNGGDPNAPAFMFTNMWVGRFNGSQGWQVALGPGAIAERPSIRADAYQQILDNPNLNPNERAHAFSYLHTSLAAQEIAENNTAKANKDIVEQAANEYAQAIHSGHGSPEMVAKLVTDPRFNSDWKTRDTLINLARSQSGSDIAGASMQYGPGFWSAYKSITAPLGDPTRITDPTALLPRAGPGGDLTLAGLDRLTKTMTEMRKSVDDTAVHTAKAGLLDYAKSKLSFDQEMLFPGVKPLADPKGKQIFDARFIPKFEAAYDAWVKDGKNPWEFLTQENVDKLMQGMRSKTEMAMDKISSRDDATGEKTAQTVPPPADIPAPAWQEVMADRPVAPSGRPVAPQNWAAAIAMVRSNPTPENIAAFNKTFKDFDAQKILDKLGGAGNSTDGVPHGESKDYDYPAAIKAGVKPDERGHWPDTYKLPTHITFSDESKFSDSKHQGGHWEHIEGDHWTFAPGPENLKHHSIAELEQYFKEYEPESKLILPKQEEAPQARKSIGAEAAEATRGTPEFEAARERARADIQRGAERRAEMAQ